MSRDSLDGDWSADGHPDGGDAVPLDEADPPGHVDAADGGSRRPPRSALRMGVAAVAVAVVAGSVGMLVGERRARTDAVAGVELLGTFMVLDWTPSVGDAARVRGQVQVVNVGADAVEVLGVEVAGRATPRTDDRPRIEPGDTAMLPVAIEVPCDADVDERLLADLAVLGPDGGRTAVDGVELSPLEVTSYFGVAEQVAGLCRPAPAGVEVTTMTMDEAGRLVASLRSSSTGPTVASVASAVGSGMRLDDATTGTVTVPPDGTVDLRVGVAVIDCAQARQAATSRSDALVLEVSEENGDSTRVDGWLGSVTHAVAGFALATQCGAPTT